MTYTSIFIIAFENVIRFVLLLAEIVALVALYFGIACSSGYFAWFAHSHLRPAMNKDLDISNAQEAFFYFFAMTIYTVIVTWGALPYYSIRAELPTLARFCSAGAFFVTSTGLIVYSLRLLFYMKLYWLEFEQDDLIYIAMHCRAMVVFTSTIVGIHAAFLITFISYTMIYGYPISVPSTLQQMKRDTRELLGRVWLGAETEDSDVEKTAQTPRV